MGKPDISKVIPALARQALLLAGGDRKAAYSRYIQLYFRQTGRFAPGITLELPTSKIQRFVHMCDYLASRKEIDIKNLF